MNETTTFVVHLATSPGDPAHDHPRHARVPRAVEHHRARVLPHLRAPQRAKDAAHERRLALDRGPLGRCDIERGKERGKHALLRHRGRERAQHRRPEARVLHGALAAQAAAHRGEGGRPEGREEPDIDELGEEEREGRFCLCGLRGSMGEWTIRGVNTWRYGAVGKGGEEALALAAERVAVRGLL